MVNTPVETVVPIDGARGAGPRPDRLQRALCDAYEQVPVPGAAVGMLAGGEERFSTFGVTNVENPLPVTQDTIFKIGSLSKAIAATVCMQLVRAGRLDLDRPVRAYLPGLRLADPDTARRVTLRDLLAHCAGLSDFQFDRVGDPGTDDDALQRTVGRMAAIPQFAPLGSVRSYCSAGFYLVGRVVELVSGGTYEEAVSALVFKPLGMKRSFFFSDEILLHRFAVGHRRSVGSAGFEVVRHWSSMRTLNAAGGVASTVRDLLRFGQFHLSSDPLVAELWKPQRPLTDTIYAKALAFFLRDVGGVRVGYHGGNALGQAALLTLVPDRGLAVAVAANGEHGLELSRRAVDRVLSECAGLRGSDAVVTSVPSAVRDVMVGWYRGEDMDYEVDVRGAELVIRAGHEGRYPPGFERWARLLFVAPSLLVTEDRETELEIVGDAGGDVGWLRLLGHVFRRDR
jgi:CubicO group peptidase (beta-lactamase class C family)